MAKLSFKSAKKAIGIGSLHERTIEFIGNDGEVFSGEIKIKRLSHAEIWDILHEKGTVTFDDNRRLFMFKTMHEDDSKAFFSKLEEVGQLSSEFVDACYLAIEDVNDLQGKNRVSAKKTSSGVSLSEAGSADEQ